MTLTPVAWRRVVVVVAVHFDNRRLLAKGNGVHRLDADIDGGVGCWKENYFASGVHRWAEIDR